MFDPQKASESLRRNGFRVDVLGWLIDMANASDALRTELDKKIWATLAERGVQSSPDDQDCRSKFCEGHCDFAEYTGLVEIKLAQIPD